MLGIVLNLILASVSSVAIVGGLLFFFDERDSGYFRIYALALGIDVFLICMSYAIMGLCPYLDFAYIPRIIGLFAIDFFPALELSFLFMELKIWKEIHGVVIAIFALYIIFDMVIFGQPSAITFVRYEFHNSYEHNNLFAYRFHYSYIPIISLTTFIFGLKWYKSQKVKRDKKFVLELVFANVAILVFALPDVIHSEFSDRYTSFGYCMGIAFAFFSLLFAFKNHVSFAPTVKNVSEDVFASVDVPILIFNFEGKEVLANPSARSLFSIREDNVCNLRSLFTLSDVETLRLLKKAKNGVGGQIRTNNALNGKPVVLSCSIRHDNTGEPFCIICTVLSTEIETDMEVEQ